MRNRIAGIMHWDHVGISHRHEARPGAERPIKGTKPPRLPGPWTAFATATLAGVAVIVTLRALFGGPSARA